VDENWTNEDEDVVHTKDESILAQERGRCLVATLNFKIKIAPQKWLIKN
jgi:hypothetical protein